MDGRPAAVAGRAAALLALAAGCGGGPKPANQPPQAMLAVTTPPPVRAGDTVAFDASGSADADGFIVKYRFVFPDGTAETDAASPRVSHRFVTGGIFDVVVIAVDDRDAEGRASVSMAVTAPAPPPPCKSAGDCAGGQICIAGTCRPPPCDAAHPCQPPLVCSEGACVPPPPPAGCAKDADCPAPRVCSLGTCACPPALSDCSGLCVDVQTSAVHCGACFKPCTAGLVCSAGACTSRPNCAKDGDCPAGQTCVAGLCKAPGGCTTDADCPGLATCAMGTCACGAPATTCTGACVDTTTDARSCGACGKACPAGQYCAFGNCAAPPACGAASTCSPDRTCSAGLCQCTGGRTDCFGFLCAALATDPQNCGACGHICGDPFTCTAGKCGQKKRGAVLDSRPLAVTGDLFTGLDAAGGRTFWASLAGGTTIEFDLLSGVTDKVPPPVAGSRPHGVAWNGANLYAGFYPTAQPYPMASLTLRYTVAGATVGGAIMDGGAVAVLAGGDVMVYANASQRLVVYTSTFDKQKSAVAVKGLAGNVVYDIAWDGAQVWMAGLDLATATTPKAFIKIVDPSTGVVADSVPAPDTTWAGGIAWDGSSIWVAGRLTLYRLSP